MDIYGQMVSLIIKEQQNIMGQIALKEATKVSGLTVNTIDDIVFDGDRIDILNRLVKQYEKLFGNASVEICKEAIEPLTDKLEPEIVVKIFK